MVTIQDFSMTCSSSSGAPVVLKDMWAEWILDRKIRGYPVHVYLDLSSNGGAERYAVSPVSRGRWIDGCLAQGHTLNEAVARLDALLPGFIRWYRKECGMSPRPEPNPRIRTHE